MKKWIGALRAYPAAHLICSSPGLGRRSGRPGNRLQEALKARDKDVAWLRSHVVQLTQQLALPPSEEEAKKNAGGNSGSDG